MDIKSSGCQKIDDFLSSSYVSVSLYPYDDFQNDYEDISITKTTGLQQNFAERTQALNTRNSFKQPMKNDVLSSSKSINNNSWMKSNNILSNYGTMEDPGIMSTTGSVLRDFEVIYFLQNDLVLETEPLLKSCRGSCNVDVEDEPKIEESSFKKTNSVIEPRDKYFFARITTFLSAVVGMLPLSFFLQANDYWMYKFRDTTSDNYDLNNKTELQALFVSTISVFTTLPNLLAVFLCIRYAHKLSIRTRFMLTLIPQTIIFLVFTVLVKINTDQWQTSFFVLCITVIGFIAFFFFFCLMTTICLISKFPPEYMRYGMCGSAAGGLLGSVLQIVSLSIGDNSTQVAFIYFSTGTVVILVTAVLTFATKYSPVFQYYLQEEKVEKLKPARTFQQYWKATKAVWFLVLMMTIIMAGLGATHANITTLVVSEGYTGTGASLWHDKYFVVTATFLLYEIFQLVGQIFARPVITKTNYHWFILISVGNTFIIGPLIWFCNAQPRSHLPVLFPHDYQYMVILAMYSGVSSWLVTTLYMSVNNTVKEEVELCYLVINAVMTLILTATCPLNPLYVKML